MKILLRKEVSDKFWKSHRSGLWIWTGFALEEVCALLFNINNNIYGVTRCVVFDAAGSINTAVCNAWPCLRK